MYQILYVDDEPGLLEIGKVFLESRGEFSVDTVISAKSAFPLIGSNNYDAIISDYQMPGMDGIEFLKAVRERFDTIPFILFTGRGREEVVIDAINNGADFYLQKGGEPKSQFAELAHKIRQAVRRRETEKELRRSEGRLRSFVETTQESVALVDEEGKVIEWNPATERITGILKGEVLGMYLWDVTFRMLPREQRTEERRAVIEERIRTSLRTGIPVFKEPRLIESEGPDGSRVYTRQTLFPLKTDKGFGIGSVSQDITSEKLAEKALLESEKKFHDLAELIPQIIFELDLDFRIIWANQYALATLGITHQDIESGINAPSFIVPMDAERADVDIEQYIRGMTQKSREFMAVRKDTSSFPVLVYSVPVYRNDSLCGFHGIAIDISERKKMEEKLRVSEDKFRGIAERSSDLILVLNNQMSPTYVSPSVHSMLGFAPEELVGKTTDFALATIFSGTGPALENAVKATMNGLPVDNVELQLKRKDESPVIVSLSAVPVLRDGRVDGAQVSMRDITEQTATQSALKAVIGSMIGTTGMSSLQQIVETIGSWLDVDCVMIGEIQPDRDTVKVLAMVLDGKQVNDFIYHLKGTPCENVAEKGFCHYPEDSVRLFPFAKDITDLNIQGYVGTPLWNSQGTLVGILCALSRMPLQLSPSVRTILETIAVKAGAEIERSQIERELKKSQQMAQRAMDLANLVNWEFDISTGLFTFNDRFYALYGTSAEREGGYRMPAEQYLTAFVHPEDQPAVAEAYRARPPTPGSRDEFQMEHRIVRRDGEIRTIVVRAGITQGSGEQGIIVHGANQDITERKKAEEALRQANKKLNLLSGITRHDITNQLLILNAFVVLLQEEVASPKTEMHFSRITEASNNIADMIRFTREYEKIGTGDPVWQYLRTVIAGTGKGIVPAQVTLDSDIPASAEVFADPMLEKVFFNLFDNAARHGERVTQIRVSCRRKNGSLVVVWEDNGVGIPNEEKERIFEREFGKNTGLGMFLAREILSLTGIAIVETGEAGKGARFEMTFPAGSWRIAGT